MVYAAMEEGNVPVLKRCQTVCRPAVCALVGYWVLLGNEAEFCAQLRLVLVPTRLERKPGDK